MEGILNAAGVYSTLLFGRLAHRIQKNGRKLSQAGWSEFHSSYQFPQFSETQSPTPACSRMLQYSAVSDAGQTSMPTPQSDLIATLRRLPLFTDLSAGELALIGERVTLRAYEAGAIVFSEGEACRELLIVKEGSVKIFKAAANGRQQLIGIERTGNSLAEIPVFDGDSYPATAQTASPTVLLRLEAGLFRGLCVQHPEVAMKVIKVLAHRLRRMGNLVEDLSFTTVRGRLIAHLLHLADESGRYEQMIEFDLTENNEELAARLGTVRELVSRNLGRLHNEGLIEVHHRKVRIPNIAALEETIRSR